MITEGLMTPPKRRTLYLLFGGLFLAIGTPVYLALARPGMRVYLLNPAIITAQAVPYFLAAGLWLPWSAPRAVAITQALAAVLFLVAVVLYVPMVTGLWITGGDMVGLGFLLIATCTAVILVVITLVAFGIQWWRKRATRP